MSYFRLITSFLAHSVLSKALFSSLIYFVGFGRLVAGNMWWLSSGFRVKVCCSKGRSICRGTPQVWKAGRDEYLRFVGSACAWVIASAACLSCSSKKSSVEEQILHGSISYPFYETKPLGINRSKEKFIIRSIVGNSEYAVEIPGAAQNYDIEIPFASMDSAGLGGPDRPRNLSNPAATDREMLKNLPSVESKNPSGAAFMDKAFGVGRAGGVGQAPSYSLGLAKINRYYRRKNFEYTLIEINHLLAFYPNSPKLHKMKGTIYNKLRNFPLAEKSWIRALELEPRDRNLKAAIRKLQATIRSRMAIEQQQSKLEKSLRDVQPVTSVRSRVLEPD